MNLNIGTEGLGPDQGLHCLPGTRSEIRVYTICQGPRSGSTLFARNQIRDQCLHCLPQTKIRVYTVCQEPDLRSGSTLFARNQIGDQGLHCLPGTQIRVYTVCQEPVQRSGSTLFARDQSRVYTVCWEPDRRSGATLFARDQIRVYTVCQEPDQRSGSTPFARDQIKDQGLHCLPRTTSEIRVYIICHSICTKRCITSRSTNVILLRYLNSAYEPRHDKTIKVTVHPAKTQISLGVRPVLSESSPCAQWVAKDPSFLHADSEDSDQTWRMPSLIRVFAGCTLICLVMSRLICTLLHLLK